MTAARSVTLLMDEMFPPRIAEQLRGRGHDVLAVAADPALRAMTDAELLAWAAERSRRIVTENVKDSRLLLGHGGGASVLFTSNRTFARSRRNLGPLIEALDAWLRRPDVRTRPDEDWLPPAGDQG